MHSIHNIPQLTYENVDPQAIQVFPAELAENPEIFAEVLRLGGGRFQSAPGRRVLAAFSEDGYGELKFSGDHVLFKGYH